MKTTRLFTVLLGAAALLAPPVLPAQEATTNASPIRAELETLVQTVQTKIAAGKNTEAELADEIKHFDTLLAKENGAKTDAAAQIAFFKALLYFQVFENVEKGTALIKQVKADYPGTKVAEQAEHVLQSLAQETEAKKIREGLVVGSVFPDFAEKDLNGQPLSVGQFKGKVVLVDFWATWCAPCVAELPGIISTYKTYHAQGFEIIGISLDPDREKLVSFLKQREEISWPQFFDDGGDVNKLAVKYGVEAVPFNLLIGPDGKIIGQNLSGTALADAVAGALGKN
jgi:thiol-disulfide isomerase/thioredoxin